MAINELVNESGGTAITGTATADTGVGVQGIGGAAGVYGIGEGGHGVAGESHHADGHGVHGRNTKGGVGVVGTSTGWIAVGGFATAESQGAAVYGEHKGGQAGVWGANHNESDAAGPGVVGSGRLAGVRGESTHGLGVHGQGPVGVKGIGSVWVGVHGETNAPPSAGAAAVWGDGKDGGDGVKGVANGPGKAAVCGFHLSNLGIGVFGQGNPAGKFQGDVHITNDLIVDGDITLTNADCAEDFDICDTAAVEAGTVVVLGPEGALRQSEGPYDRRVAGVISGAGDYKPGIVLDKQQSQPNRKPVALLGKVFCKVDAQYGAIEVGDLLTTSPSPGHAMKAADPLKAFGAIIGKALRPLKEGHGLIPILIALQ